MTAIRFFIISFFIFDISIGLTQTKQEKGVEYNNLEEALKNPNKVYRLNLGNQKNLPKKFDLSVFKNLEFLSFENNNLEEIPGIETETIEEDQNIKTNRVKIIDNQGAQAIGKPMGTYVTIDIKNLKITILTLHH